MERIFVIGAGPSGMMAAISAKIHNENCDIFLIEKNPEVGRKLKLTGGGRCNVTANLENFEIIENIPKNGKFLYSSLFNFSSMQIIDFFESRGCFLKEEDHARMFPKSGKAIDIVNTLLKEIEKLKIKLLLSTTVEDISKDEIITSNGSFKYDYLIIAMGSKILPNTGSDGKGYEIAKKHGHNITPLLPAEVPLVSNDEFIRLKILQGLSFKDIMISIFDDKKNMVKSIIHDLLFTHFGISGPAALRASFYILNLLNCQERVFIEIDFLPNYDFKDLIDKKLEFEKILRKNNIPNRLIQYITSKFKNIEEIIENFKKFGMNVYSTRGLKSAFVINGGIDLKEINPKTMKSKINNKISFCGEILDINGFTGGFNITAAFSTGFSAGKFVKI